MRKKWMYLLGISALVLGVLAMSVPQRSIDAQSGTNVFLPKVFMWDGSFFDDFQDMYPAWQYHLLKDPTDGSFEHMNGVYAAHIRDNAAMIVASPGWRPDGDYVLEVDARFTSPWTIDQKLKSLNSMGLAFAGNNDWSKFYAFLLADGGAQHWYSIVRVNTAKFTYLLEWRAGPTSMKGWSSTNHISVLRRGDEIRIYCNGSKLGTGGTITDNHYGLNRMVGLIVTSYEFAEGEMEFDNFKMRPYDASQFTDDQLDALGAGLE
jgi:hypothetical protein